MLHFFILFLFIYYRCINITNTLIHFFISTFVYVFFVYVFPLYLFLCGYKLMWGWTQSEAQLQWCDLLQRRSCYCCVKEQKSWQKFKKKEFDNRFWRTWQSMTFRSDPVGGTVSAFSCCTPSASLVLLLLLLLLGCFNWKSIHLFPLIDQGAVHTSFLSATEHCCWPETATCSQSFVSPP